MQREHSRVRQHPLSVFYSNYPSVLPKPQIIYSKRSLCLSLALILTFNLQSWVYLHNELETRLQKQTNKEVQLKSKWEK
jgi:hypothetical protein